MPMEAGFWKQIDPKQLTSKEVSAFTPYRNAVESKAPLEKREEARKQFIEALTPRFAKNNLIPEGKELTVMYNKRILCVGFPEKSAPQFFDMGNP